MTARILALASALSVCAAAQQLQSSPFHGDKESVGAGRAAYRLRCSACHGIHAGGGRGPALNRGNFEAGDTDLDIYRVIERGVPGTEMPAFGPRSTEENIWRIVSYLRTFEPGPAEDVQGDAQVGEQLFWSKGGCGACHRVGSRGGAFGPDLTRIGRSRSVEHLRESLLNPDEDLPPGYFVVRAVHHDGRTTTGIGVAFDDFSAQLRDSTGKLHSFLREEVRSLEREYTSLMPPGYGESLTEDEQLNLLAYMKGLRGGGAE